MAFCPKCGTAYEENTQFCGKCGEVLGNAPQAAQAPQATAVPNPAPQQQNFNYQQPGVTNYAPNYQNGPYVKQPGLISKLRNTKDITQSFDPNDIASNKVLAILAYCGIFAYILFSWLFGNFVGLIIGAALLIAPCISVKKSPYIRYVLSQVFAALFFIMLVGIIEGTIAGWFYGLIYGAIAGVSAGLGSLAGSLGYSGGNIGTANVVATLIAWLIHLIFMAIPGFVVVIGFIDTIKGKVKDLPIIGRLKVIFEDKQ